MLYGLTYLVYITRSYISEHIFLLIALEINKIKQYSQLPFTKYQISLSRHLQIFHFRVWILVCLNVTESCQKTPWLNYPEQLSNYIDRFPLSPQPNSRILLKQALQEWSLISIKCFFLRCSIKPEKKIKLNKFSFYIKSSIWNIKFYWYVIRFLNWMNIYPALFTKADLH